MNPIYPSGICKELEPYIDPPSVNQNDLVDNDIIQIYKVIIDRLLIPTMEKSLEEIDHIEKLYKSLNNTIKYRQSKSDN